MSNAYDVIVVGGGHNGLVAAGYLAKHGLRTVVLEKRHVVGGAAISERPFGPDYTVTALSYVVSLLPPSLVRDLELDQHGYHVYPQGPYFAPRRDGQYLQLPSDRARRREQIEKFSSKDADAIEVWDRKLDELARILGPLLGDIPPKVGSRRPKDLVQQALLLRRLKDVDTRKAVDITRLLTSSIADLVEDHFESDAMQAVLSVSGVIGTWAGPRSAGTAYVMLHHHLGGLGEAENGQSGDGRTGAWGFPRGGMGAVTGALAAAAQSFGAEIRTEAGVAQISTTAGAATGVVLESGDVLTASTVITTAHPQISFLQLLDRRDLPADFVEEIETWKSRSGTVKVNLAVDRLPEFASKPGYDPEVHGGTIVVAESMNDIETAFQEAVTGKPATLPFADICIPSVFDDSLAPEGQHIVSMFTQWVPHTWNSEPHQAELDAYADRLVARMDDVAPGLRRLGAAPPGDRPVHDGARVRPGRRQHLPRRADRRAAVPRPTGRRLRRPADPDPRAVPGRLGHAWRRRRHRCTRPQRRQAGARGPQAVGAQASHRAEGLTSVGRLQAALPREHYVDPQTWQVERERVLTRSWTCAGRLHDLGLTTPGRLAVVVVHGESVLLTVAKDGCVHAHFNVCRHRGSQLVMVEPGTELPAPGKSWALRCPYHSWTYDLDGSLRYAPHTEDVDDFDPAEFSLHRVGVEVWGGFVWLNLDPAGVRSLLDELGPIPDRLRRYPLDSLVVGHRMVYAVAANWKLIAENYNECYHCGPVHPELVQLVPAFGGGGQDIDWDGGVPHREGAWTFTASGTSDRTRFPDLDADERERHKGELVYPNLLLSLSPDHVAAFLLESMAVDRTRVTCDLLFAPDEVARPSFDPSDAADFWDVVNRQDWAICASVQRGMTSRAYQAGLVRADGGRLARHPSLAAPAAGGLMAERHEYAVVGLGALGSATAWQLARRGASVVGLERFALGHDRGASHDSSRILRHSYHTPDYVRLTFEAYDDWATLEADAGESFVTVTGGLDLFPPGCAIPPDDYTSSMTACSVPYSILDTAAVSDHWPQLSLPDGTTAVHQERTAIVPAARGTAAMQLQAVARGAVLRSESPVTAVRDLGTSGLEVEAGGVTYLVRRLVVTADAWSNDVLRHLGLELPLTVTQEQVTYFTPPRPQDFAPDRFPVWIWMDEPSFYGFPTYGEATVKAAQDCGGPVVTGDDRSFEPDDERCKLLADFMTQTFPGSGPVTRSKTCLYTLTPDRDFVLGPVPGHESVVVGAGPRTASSSRRRSGGCSPTSRAPASAVHPSTSRRSGSTVRR